MIRTSFSAAVLTIAFVLSSNPASAQDKNKTTYRQLNLFGDVFERVRADYVDKSSDEKLIENAINGMLTSLDPHSSYMNEKSFRDMQVQTKGEFGGLGIEVTMKNGVVKVVSPIDGTPAFRAGVKPGDLITHLDKVPVLGLSLSAALEKMRGPVDTDIVLMIRRKNREPFEVTLKRAVIKIQSVRSRVERSMGYIRITSFNEQTEKGVKRAMKSIEERLEGPPKGLVLDLRNNPGGLLEQAIAVSDAFLERGEIVSTRSRRAEDSQRFNAKPGDLAENVAIVILINGGSASASEIVAGALQDHRRAIILGTRSFGKGSVQTIIPLTGHGAMRLTTARYYTPSGRSIQAKGIEPDIKVEQARLEVIDQSWRTREENLRGALKNPTENQKSKDDDPTAKPATESEGPQDYQLSRALDLLQSLALFKEQSKPN